MSLPDSTVLKDAIASLEQSCAVVRRKEQENNLPAEEMETLRGGVIQAFEYTYELCWKAIKRDLEYNVNKEKVQGASRKKLFRFAAETTSSNPLKIGLRSTKRETRHHTNTEAMLQ